MVACRVAIVLFGAGVLVGVVRSIVLLVGQGHPDPEFGYYVFDDALQMYSGHWSYQDPTVGYVGFLYPPGYMAVLAALLHIKVWTGWGMIVSAIAGLTLAGMVAGIAYRRVGPPDAKAMRVLEASAIGLIGLWLVAFAPVPSSFESRPDTTAWALGFGGLLLTPRGLKGSRGSLVAATLLLTAAFWTKQPAATTGLAAGCWAVWASLFRLVPWRRTVVFILALAVANAAVAGFLALATHGWAIFYIFEMARRHFWGLLTYEQIARQTWTTVWLPLLATVAVVGLGFVAWRRGRRSAPETAGPLTRDPDVQQALLLTIFLVITASIETYFQRKQGAGHENHLLGQLWALAMLTGLGWRCAGRLPSTRLAAAGVVTGLGLLGVVFGTADHGPLRRVPMVVNTVHIKNVPEELLEVARHGTLYALWFSELGRQGDHVPAMLGTCDMSSAGIPSTGMERDFANRRYDYVISLSGVTIGDCSGYGKWEENYYESINVLIDQGYEHRPDLPPDVRARRSQPEAAVDARNLFLCFAPYRLGGVLFRLGHGGGFWCQRSRSAPVLSFLATPAPESEILTDGTITAIEGSLVIDMPNGSSDTNLGTTTDPGGPRKVIARLHDADTSGRVKMVVTFGPIRGRAALAAVAQGAQIARIDPATVHGKHLSIITSTESDVRLDFSGLTIHTEHGYLRGAIARRGLPGSGDL